ncbi:hypothetical protein, partial [Achromobacter xylosoxidans]|uniref:hypothetical protein n=1 Tax=Alcaligenes xylosoxydans xylosoxydans TaxID=85698 RepID=UPI0034D5EC5C
AGADQGQKAWPSPCSARKQHRAHASFPIEWFIVQRQIRCWCRRFIRPLLNENLLLTGRNFRQYSHNLLN